MEEKRQEKKTERKKEGKKTTLTADGLKIYANWLPAFFRFISRFQFRNHIVKR